MTSVELLSTAEDQIDGIAQYTRINWGEQQAERYVRGLFQHLDKLASNRVLWRRLPEEFGVEGYFARYQSHYIFWRYYDDDTLAVFAILHENMDLPAQVRRLAGQ